MSEKYYHELEEKNNLRENLSLLRSAVKDPQEKEKILALAGDGGVLTGLLVEEEPKVRKNAALLLGDLELAQAKEALFEAYNKEETLFVKSAYLTALRKIGAPEKLAYFRARLDELTGGSWPEQEKKHIREQVRELEQIIIATEGIRRHTFNGFSEVHEILLATTREQRKATLEEVAELPAGVRRKAELHPLGVLVHTKEVFPFVRLRTYRELLFPVHTKRAIKPGASAQAAARAVWESDLYDMLTEFHGEEAPFYFRLELKNRLDLDERSSFAKRFATELESLSGRLLINSTTNYELEIRLTGTKDGGLVPFLKLATIRMRRFAYRKNAGAASIHPAAAAMLVQLAKPYLKEDAQILDPFCGVGTMLIERNIRVPAREIYGIDKFGDAIGGAWENASAAGVRISFINRDYFDFRHNYLFDEIITNMPVRGKHTKEEMDAFYGRFFEKSKSVLRRGAVVILYSNEEGFVKKYLRLNREYRMLDEFCVREKDHFSLFVMEYRGEASCEHS